MSIVNEYKDLIKFTFIVGIIIICIFFSFYPLIEILGENNIIIKTLPPQLVYYSIMDLISLYWLFIVGIFILSCTIFYLWRCMKNA